MSCRELIVLSGQNHDVQLLVEGRRREARSSAALFSSSSPRGLHVGTARIELLVGLFCSSSCLRVHRNQLPNFTLR